MSQIYAGSTLVLGWLGESADDSDYTIDTLYKVAEVIRRHEENETRKSPNECVNIYEIGLAAEPKETESSAGEIESTSLTRGPDPSGIKLFNPATLELRGGDANSHSDSTTIKLAKLLDNMPELTKEDRHDYFGIPNHAWGAIKAFFKRQFWERLWIRQEMVLAQDIILLCGRKELMWSLVSFVEHYFNKSMRENSHYLPPSLRNEVMGMNWGRISTIQIWRDATKRAQEHGELHPIYNIITDTAGLKASNPRDHIYGILGISEYGHSSWEIPIDYTCRIEDLYSEFSSHWIDFAAKASSIDLKINYHPLNLAGIGYHRQFTALPS